MSRSFVRYLTHLDSDSSQGVGLQIWPRLGVGESSELWAETVHPPTVREAWQGELHSGED